MHLTVNEDGLVSLWDSSQQALEAAAREGESYVRLVLTDDQQLALSAAQEAAQ
jgi:hypothetical protein